MNIDEQKQKLIAEKKDLEKDLNALGRKIGETEDWVISTEDHSEEHADTLDEANITEEIEDKVAVLNVLESRYEQVERALRAIENGTYGICEVEGCDISPERLKANPSATTCIKHAQ